MKLVNYDKDTGKIIKVYDKDAYCKVVTYVDVEADEESGEEAHKKEVVTYDTSKIPKPYAEVSYDEYREALSIGANFFDAKTGKFGIKDFRAIWQKTKDLQRSLLELCDYRHNRVMHEILGYKSTEAQIERYKNKYDRAIVVKAQIEAGDKLTESSGYIVANYDTIIAKHESVEEAMNKYIDTIEDFRRKISKLIKEKKFKEAEDAIARPFF